MGSKADVTSGLLGAGGSLVGYFMGQGDRDKAAQDYQDAINAYGGVNTGVTAQNAKAANQGPSAYNSLSVDPAGRASQLAALNRLQSIYGQGGMDAQAKAEMATQQQGANQNAQALNSQVQNNMAQRGLSSSGANFAAQRANAQNAANQSNLAGLHALASGQSRALQALQGSAQVGTQMRGQDYNQASDRAAANDAIGRFNAQNTTQNNQYNAGLSLQGQEATSRNQLARAQGMAGGYTNQAANYGGQAQKIQEMGQGVGQATGAVIGGGADQADTAAQTVMSSGGSGGGSGGGEGGNGKDLLSMFGSFGA